jgi:hypothetical protein
MFHAAEHVETAVAEEAFYRLLFFLDAPGTRRPANPQETPEESRDRQLRALGYGHLVR